MGTVERQVTENYCCAGEGLGFGFPRETEKVKSAKRKRTTVYTQPENRERCCESRESRGYGGKQSGQTAWADGTSSHQDTGRTIFIVTNF